MTPVLCDSVARWQEVVPVAAALRNPAMQDRHWTKLQQELGTMLPVGPAFTLQTLFDLKVTCSADRRLVSPAALVRGTCMSHSNGEKIHGNDDRWVNASRLHRRHIASNENFETSLRCSSLSMSYAMMDHVIFVHGLLL